MVTINGQQEAGAAGMTLLEYLTTHDYNPAVVVVERNEAIVPREQVAETVIEDGDTLEIVMFMGGG